MSRFGVVKNRGVSRLLLAHTASIMKLPPSLFSDPSDYNVYPPHGRRIRSSFAFSHLQPQIVTSFHTRLHIKGHGRKICQYVHLSRFPATGTCIHPRNGCHVLSPSIHWHRRRMGGACRSNVRESPLGGRKVG